MKLTEIPEHLRKRAEQARIKVQGGVDSAADIPAHLLERVRTRGQQAPIHESSYLHVHNKEECQHGRRGRWCRCTDMSHHFIVSCESVGCTVKAEDDYFGSHADGIPELEDKLFSACLTLLANDIELPVKIRSWFNEYNKLHAKL